MKFVFSLILLIPYCVKSQSAMYIVNKSIKVCDTISSGFYEMVSHTKSLDGDSSSTFSKCIFQRNQLDSVFGFHFDIGEVNNHYWIRSVNKDNYLVQFSSIILNPGCTGEPPEWRDPLCRVRMMHHFFSPLINIKEFGFLYSDSNDHCELIGREQVNKYNTFHVRINRFIPQDSSDYFQIVTATDDIWINEVDYIPVKHCSFYSGMINGEFKTQISQKTLISYSLNKNRVIEFIDRELLLKSGYHFAEWKSGNYKIK